jgi:hypothetical protein
MIERISGHGFLARLVVALLLVASSVQASGWYLMRPLWVAIRFAPR